MKFNCKEHKIKIQTLYSQAKVILFQQRTAVGIINGLCKYLCPIVNGTPFNYEYEERMTTDEWYHLNQWIDITTHDFLDTVDQVLEFSHTYNDPGWNREMSCMRYYSSFYRAMEKDVAMKMGLVYEDLVAFWLSGPKAEKDALHACVCNIGTVFEDASFDCYNPYKGADSTAFFRRISEMNASEARVMIRRLDYIIEQGSIFYSGKNWKKIESDFLITRRYFDVYLNSSEELVDNRKIGSGQITIVDEERENAISLLYDQVRYMVYRTEAYPYRKRICSACEILGDLLKLPSFNYNEVLDSDEAKNWVPIGQRMTKAYMEETMRLLVLVIEGIDKFLTGNKLEHAIDIFNEFHSYLDRQISILFRR